MESGLCEPEQVCSFPDANCPDGRRYGTAAGILSEHCVAAEPPDAGPTFDASPEVGGQLTITTPLTSLSVCGFGGYQVDIGVDVDGNGMLDVDELEISEVICLESCPWSWIELTKDFKNQGTFVTVLLDDDELAVTAFPGDVNVLNFNGLGVVGGSNDVVEAGEALTFSFSEPAFSVSYVVPAAGNTNNDNVVGERTIQALNQDAEPIWSALHNGTGAYDVLTPRPETPMFHFVDAVAVDAHRVGSV